MQDQAGGADSGDLELAVMRPPSEGHSRPVVEPEKMHFWQLPHGNALSVGPSLAMEKHSMRKLNRLCGSFVVLTAIIVCVAIVVSMDFASFGVRYFTKMHLRYVFHLGI